MTERTPMITETTADIVADARETLVLRWAAELQEERTKLTADAEAAWLHAELQRKANFVQEYRRKHNVNDNAPTNPYLGLSDGAAVRVATPAESRYAVLAEYGYFEELLYCWLARNRFRATIDDAKAFFAPYLPVDGDTKIIETLSRHREVVHATGLSKPLADLLTSTWAVDVECGDHLDREGHRPRRVLTEHTSARSAVCSVQLSFCPTRLHR
jgi:hypothetical protein